MTMPPPTTLCPFSNHHHFTHTHTHYTRPNNTLRACGFHPGGRYVSPATTWLHSCISGCINPITEYFEAVIITVVHAYKTTRVTCHIKPPTLLLTPLFCPGRPSRHPQLIPGSDGGGEGATEGWVTGVLGWWRLIVRLSLLAVKRPRQSVSALVPGQSYMSLCVKAQRWQTAGERRMRGRWRGRQWGRYCSFQSQEGRTTISWGD